MKLFIISYGIVVAIGAVLVASDPGYFGAIGFLVIGVLIGIYPSFLIEEFRHEREQKNLTVSLFYEVANRVVGCIFDFEAPWHYLYQKPSDLEVLRVAKFAPDPPVIYSAVASQIAVLDRETAQAIIRFYMFLAAWRRDIEDTVAQYSKSRKLVPARDVARLASRLRMTLQPGQEALELLECQVPDAKQIELDAISRLDRLFPDMHPNAGKSVRERIAIELRATDNVTS